MSVRLLTKLFFILNTVHFTSQVSLWFCFFFPFASSVRSSSVHPKMTAKITFPIFKSWRWNFHTFWSLWNFHLLQIFVTFWSKFLLPSQIIHSSYMSSKGASDRSQLLNLYEWKPPFWFDNKSKAYVFFRFEKEITNCLP